MILFLSVKLICWANTFSLFSYILFIKEFIIFQAFFPFLRGSKKLKAWMPLLLFPVCFIFKLLWIFILLFPFLNIQIVIIGIESIKTIRIVPIIWVVLIIRVLSYLAWNIHIFLLWGTHWRAKWSLKRVHWHLIV